MNVSVGEREEFYEARPLRNRLERLAELDPGTVLVQLDDRAPRRLYPELDDQGYAYETPDTERGVAIVIREP